MPQSPHQLYQDAVAALSSAGVPSPEVDARALIEHVLGQPTYLWPPTVNQETADAIETLIARRVSREPLQHILGKQWFMGLELCASPAAMCVRPETEVMTQWAVEWLKTRPQARVLDLCTGSGAIALAIADRYRDAAVIAVEISPVACDLARANARVLDLPIDIITADATEFRPEWERNFDLVIANPPYVPPRNLSLEVAHDPELALWGGGADGLDIPSRIIAVAAQYLTAAGVFLMEHDDTQGRAVRALAEQRGLTRVKTHQDLAGRDRFVVGFAPETIDP
ncbi:MAG: peptide chain release factor N(5)-glutamine methyltransferase [Actinomycetaceae bacterium]|nr:peptide chain release factor N(5)-glutamine methyltransferase [Actinomycetaceae bacterium]